MSDPSKTSYWEFTLPLIHNSFEPIDEPNIVTWHEGPFKGHNLGLNDNDAPEGLQDEVLKFDEVRGVHEIMKVDPDYFFNTLDHLWLYTGGSGKVPDAVGFSSDGSVIIGEIKWLRGWHKELPRQIESYLGLFYGKLLHRNVEIRIAAAQTLSEETKKMIIVKMKQLSLNWLSMSLYFGYLQIGWSNSPNKFYLKCEWKSQQI